MKLILFSGDHPRHLFVNQKVLEFFDESLVVIMQREELLPEPPSALDKHDEKLFKLHNNAVFILVVTILISFSEKNLTTNF